MAIAHEHVGRSYPPTAPYVVSAAKIAEFARAIGDSNPAYFTEHPLAPPTFVAVIAADAWETMFADEDLGLALRRIMHGDQRFTYARALRAGDVVHATVTIDRVRTRDTADIISATARIETLTGEPVCTAEATFFHKREAAA